MTVSSLKVPTDTLWRQKVETCNHEVKVWLDSFEDWGKFSVDDCSFLPHLPFAWLNRSESELKVENEGTEIKLMASQMDNVPQTCSHLMSGYPYY